MTDYFACQIDETMTGDESMSLTLPRPKPPKKKTIEYGPAPKHLVEAVRKELRRLVDLPDLDANLGMISRFAMQSDDMLTSVKAPKAIMRAEHEVTIPGVTDAPGNVETYGANFLRTIFAQIGAQQSAAMQSPEMLVGAIAAARRDGMTDVAGALEKKLLGQPLDGARPVDGAVHPAVRAAVDQAMGLPAKGRGRKKPPALVQAGADPAVHQNGSTP
jgi:hypothetical protein